MQARQRLNTHEFLALRSIAREPWDLREDRIQWRFNGRWFYVVARPFSREGHSFTVTGVRVSLESVDGKGGRLGYDHVVKRAWNAASSLQARGLVEVFTVLCCPDPSCHASERHELRLTSSGSALLSASNPPASAQVTVQCEKSDSGLALPQAPHRISAIFQKIESVFRRLGLTHNSATVECHKRST